jgi:hypothetical protein
MTSIYRAVFNSGDFDLRTFRPYFNGDGIACISVPDGDNPRSITCKEVSGECARLTKEQWIQIDQAVVEVVRSQFQLVNALREQGFIIFSRPKDFNRDDVVFISRDFLYSDEMSAARAAAQTVAKKVEQVIHEIYKNDKPTVYLNVSTIQRTPIYNDPSTFGDDAIYSVVCALVADGDAKDYLMSLCDDKPE